MEEIINNGGKVKILFSSGFGITEWKAVKALNEIGVELMCYQNENVFHTKGRTDILTYAVIGSSFPSLRKRRNVSQRTLQSMQF